MGQTHNREPWGRHLFRLLTWRAIPVLVGVLFFTFMVMSLAVSTNGRSEPLEEAVAVGFTVCFIILGLAFSFGWMLIHRWDHEAERHYQRDRHGRHHGSSSTNIEVDDNRRDGFIGAPEVYQQQSATDGGPYPQAHLRNDRFHRP